ncbi:MAG: prolipoprotein diacylglyceryl transferase [Candidatus Gastranaerophilaceae bacterium]
MTSIILTSPGEIAFCIKDFPIYYYGICIATGAILGFVLSYFLAKKIYKDFDSDVLYDVVTFSIIGGFIFARLYYCLLNYQYYFIHPNEILFVRQGGLSIQGGILGGLFVGGWYAKMVKLPVLKIADIMSLGLILAQAIGRWGNFFNSEAYGLPTSGIISVFIPETKRVLGYETFKYFHPTFLYESVLDILILLILYFVISKIKYRFEGLIFASYLILYSSVRFFVEGLRLDSIVNVGNLHIAQIVSIFIIIFASIFIIVRKQKI